MTNDETLDGYGEYYSRSRVMLSKLPTLYFSQAKDTDMKMRICDKARELNESSPQKTERLYRESGEHSNVLNLLGMSEFRIAMFVDSSDRLIYFRNKKTRERISLVELASGI